MAKGSDSPFPSVLLVPGSAPAAPASGQVRLFIDDADGLLKTIDEFSVIRLVDPEAANPKASLVAGKVYAAATFK